MLDYLVTSRVRKRLLRLLWEDGAAGSMRELAITCGSNVAATRRELELMEGAGLARSERIGNARVFRANRESGQADLLRALLCQESQAVSAGPSPYEDDVLRTMLGEYGAPLLSRRGAGGDRPRSLEELAAHALRLSHRDPSVALVLPLVLNQNRHSLNFETLRHWASRNDERQALGLFLELTAELTGIEDFRREAGRLRDRRIKKTRPYFTTADEGRYTRELAERNTPEIARRWHYRMNLPMESFASHFRKFSDGPSAPSTR